MFSYQVGSRHSLRLLRGADAEDLFETIDANRTYMRTWLPWLDNTASAASTRAFIQSTLQRVPPAMPSGFTIAL